MTTKQDLIDEVATLRSRVARLEEQRTRWEAEEKRLRVSELRFRMICENAPVMIDAFDPSGRCLLWNKECERTLGWTSEDIESSDDPLALTYPDRALRDTVLDHIKQADGKFRDYRVRAKDGSTRTQLWADFRLPTGSLISCGVDITARKAAEDALQRARDDLETRVRERTADLSAANAQLSQELNKRLKAQAALHRAERLVTVGTLATGIAHEINNPIGGILLATRVAQQATKEQETKRTLDDIAAEAKRCGKIVNDLLALCRDETLTKRRLDINALLHRVRDLVRHQLMGIGPELELVLDHNVPHVLANELQIEQVFFNIVKNAIDASAEQIKISTETRDDSVRILVEDDGTGMPEEVRRRVFGSVHTAGQRSGGAGLGLSIAHAVLMDHNGTIELESSVGAGTQVSVVIPSGRFDFQEGHGG